MGSSTSQLALGLVLRFTDQGSGAAAKALDGVKRSLDGVSSSGERAAQTAERTKRGMIGVGEASAQATRATQASGGGLVVWTQRATAATGAATSAAHGITQVGVASNAAAGAVALVTQRAQAATQALERMHSTALRLASSGGGIGGGGGGPLLLGGPAGSNARRPYGTPAADVVDAAIINRNKLSGRDALNVGMAVGGAYMGAKAVLAPPIKQTMDYERQLAHLANTGMPEGTLAQRQALMGTMNTKIMDAVRAGGGSRENALGTLDKMVSSGAYENTDAALKDLPALVKFGTAANADSGELADIAIKARQTMGITNMGAVLDKAMRAGQLGGFELKDMAKWLPKQMALAQKAGLSGESGLTAILAANQASAVTAGSKDEAGNNLVNILAKLNSSDTAVDAKKLGINLPATLAKAREKGVNGLDAFVNLVEQVVAKDPEYTKLAKKAAAAKGDEQKAMYADMANIMKGSSVGKLVQDQQALLALIGIMQQRHAQGDQSTAAITGKINTAAGTGDKAYELISELPSAKAERLAAEKANAMQTAMSNVNPVLGKMADGLSWVAREFPTFTAGMWAATTALTALTAAAAGAALSRLATGGGAGAGAAGAGLAGRVAGSLGQSVGATSALGLAGAVGVAGMGGYALGTVLYDQVIQGTKTADAIGESIAQIVAFLGVQEAKNAIVANRQMEAAEKQIAAADALKNSGMGLDMDKLNRDISNYQNTQARRK